MALFEAVVPRLPVLDLARTREFYVSVLGFRVDVSWPEIEPSFLILERDRTSVAFFTPNEHQPGPPGYAELYIAVAGVSELHQQLAARVPIEWGPEVYSYGRREFAVVDPNGYLLIFTEETSDSPETQEPG